MANKHIEKNDWWRGAVIYQIYPRSFQDSNGDGIGDLPGITRRLGHVADLGADAIWISPFFASPMKDFGYDVSDYRQVDPMFGNLEDFKDLLAEAHRLGLKVMIDQVISHSSDRHPWFLESRSSRDNTKADWYVWADAKPDGTAPNNWLAVFGGSSWQWDSRRRQYYLHNFLVEQPDLNFHNPEVRQALLDEMRFWLDLGVDGFRLDTINFYFHDAQLRDNPAAEPSTNEEPPTNPYSYQDHLYDKTRPENPAFLEDMGRLLAEYPGTVALGEVTAGPRSHEIIAEYTAPGRVHMCYGFDFLNGPLSAEFFAETIADYDRNVRDGWTCWSFSNHDRPRHASRWAPDPSDRDAVARLSVVLLGCLRGTVCVYQGEELGLGEADIAFEDLQDPYGITFWPDVKGRDGCRTPMPWEAGATHGGFSESKPWLPLGAGHPPLSVSEQRGDENSMLAHYRRFLTFRREHLALIRGEIDIISTVGDVLAINRRDGDENLICVFNLSPRSSQWEIPAEMTLTPVDGHGLSGAIKDGTVRLGPWQGLIAAAR
ncbi:MAG: alpha-glucosidase family protein [Rhodospirillales bacterium]|nr:alpha-glucosidase family protein [Rhodospirillales bacterium]